GRISLQITSDATKCSVSPRHFPRCRRLRKEAVYLTQRSSILQLDYRFLTIRSRKTVSRLSPSIILGSFRRPPPEARLRFRLIKRPEISGSRQGSTTALLRITC